MITVNGNRIDWHEGMTIREILQVMRYSFKLLVIKVDGKLVKRDDYDSTTVPDEAEVLVIHLMSGG
ncbi:MAG: sulfur carrier protein ThiS [Candidatus Cloacimonadota bacterium]